MSNSQSLDRSASPADGLRLTRRTAITGASFVGYAVAAASATAEPVHTDDKGLETATVTLSNDLPAYVAKPAGPGPHPAVLVIHEAFGLHEYIRDVCRRLAKQGYVAIAPAFFVRLGDTAPLTEFPAIMAIVNGTPDDQVLGDIRAAVDYLRADPSVDIAKLGVTGFCWGGRWAWLACEVLPDFRAGVAWYGGMVPTPVNSSTPIPGVEPAPDRLWPSEHVAQLHAPILGLYGGKDPLTTTVPAMREALASVQADTSEIIVYPNSEHGFHSDYRASYNAPDAIDAWGRMLAHFRNNGVG